MNRPALEIAVTTWNSATFIGVALGAIDRVCADWRPTVTVFDNESTDDTVAIAKRFGARVLTGRLSQADALNVLAKSFTARRGLLMHADVVLLDASAFARCMERLDQGAALVSPEDIGCGPWTRPFGRGMPESSFLLFDTEALGRLREWRWFSWRWPFRRPRYVIDFYGPHITHHLPKAMAARGLRWESLRVHASPAEDSAWYVPDGSPAVWRDDLGSLRYGLGNFYSIDGYITHYHNWYERALNLELDDPRATTGRNGEGFPLQYVKQATIRFLEDYHAGRVRLPGDLNEQPEPVAL